MQRLFLSLLVLATFSLSAQQKPPPSPEQIQKEIISAKEQYRRAKNMFNPWYTGPLITPSPSMMPPGQYNIQPYLFVGGTYATFNEDRHSISLSHNQYSLRATSGMFIGITKSVDFTFTPSAVVNWQDRHTGGGFNDLSATAGFLINPESLYIPGMKFTITETFPTGKYQHLSFNGLGLNSTGGGTYQTQFGFGISKVIWWLYPHPMNLRYFIGYTIETPVHVKGFNTYGGGLNTDGVVHPGNTLTADLGIECSLSQRWVLALDVAYVAQNRTKFHGTSTNAVGGGYNDNLSLAPAIEYNWNPNLGILWGVQFSVYGRNSSNFATGQFSVTYTW